MDKKDFIKTTYDQLDKAMKDILIHLEQQYDQWVKNGFKDPPQSTKGE